jgi:hypothetical protein
MNDAGVSPGPRIYNLFPLLAGPFPRWTSYLERARAMEFNWVFINPFHRAGYSGSLYSIADYYDIDPRLVDSARGPPRSIRRSCASIRRGTNAARTAILFIRERTKTAARSLGEILSRSITSPTATDCGSTGSTSRCITPE